MRFSEVVDQAIEFLRRRERVSYRALKREFDLDDESLEDLKAELINAQRIAADEDDEVLVWAGASVGQDTETRRHGEAEKEQRASSDARRHTRDSRLEGERRQLTVLFCDLVGSTALSEQLDPEELREIVRAYQQASAEVIARYEGHIAQYLGDGLLVYFGYPVAHEDDATRAVRAGLGIVETMQELNTRLLHPLQVRIGIHTGPVVVGEMGAGSKREQLALGETPNIAARVQGKAKPDSVVMSAATYRLVQGLFECHELGPQPVKGLSIPLVLYRVVGESTAQSRFEVAVSRGLTPLVGREEELGLLRQRWAQAKEGQGQVVLLSGEPGIGKSRLVQELKDHLALEGVTRIEFRCSPYHQNSALYPIIEHLQRMLQFAREDMPATKLEKLQHTLSHYRFPQADTVPLLAALLSLPHPEGSPPITMSPQKQKEKTHAALVAWLVEEAERQLVYNTWEDVHWADPSTLEVLNLVVDQAPTARLYVLLTFRPEFNPPWGNRSHINQITLSRLARPQTEAMVEQVTGGEALPSEVVRQIVAKTDGVPLFVEEVTKSVMESIGAFREAPRQLEIPTTLHDALTARLDRLGTVKEVAQLGATLGREFSYELLQAVCPLDEERLQHGLKQLVEAELLYQRGLGSQAQYLFKHALIQDTAYQSLLKSTRQQLHQQIARVLEERFPEAKETQPELLAHHYTEAELSTQAVPYWQRAGQRASQRSAHVEAIGLLTKGLELLQALPDTPERTQQELTLQITLGVSLMAAKGWAAPEVEQAYSRARALCQQAGEAPQLFPVLWGLWAFYAVRGELQIARELAEQGLRLAQHIQDPTFLVGAHYALGASLLWLGELPPAQAHLEQGIACYDLQQHRSHASLYGWDLGVGCLWYVAWPVWMLGYPSQALQRMHEALTLARELSHPNSLAWVLTSGAYPHQFRRETRLLQERLEAGIALAQEHGFALQSSIGLFMQGWVLAEQGQAEEGIRHLQQGLETYQALSTELARSLNLALLAEVYGKGGQAEEGLAAVTEALAHVHKSWERIFEAELYRLKGELLLAQEGYRL